MARTRRELDLRPKEATVIFLHIGKTGGSTLRKVLHRNFRRSQILLVQTLQRLDTLRPRREATVEAFARLPEEKRAGARLIEGHMIFGPHEFVPGPSTYITILRKPVALAISQYRYVLRTPGHRLHDLVTSSGMTLEDYARSGVSLELDNSQTRVIAGDTSTPFAGCSEEMLDTAKRHIDDHFAVVGLTERFDESLVLLGETFGWTRLSYVRVKVAPKVREPIPEKTIRLLEEQNRLDAELYEYASRRLQQAIKGSPTFKQNLRRFQRNNAMYRPIGALTYTIPQRIFSSIRLKPAARAAAFE